MEPSSKASSNVFGTFMSLSKISVAIDEVDDILAAA
jgi:hypothetical protein